MELQALTALNPLDGRYRSQTEFLSPYFSEWALIRYRVLVEVEYFIALASELGWPLGLEQQERIREIYRHFSLENAQAVKTLEKVTNHDVKAVEYFLKEQWKLQGLGRLAEWVHFGLTSQDINNTAIPLLWKECIVEEYLPRIRKLNAYLKRLADSWMGVPMLSRTHGQAATPTKLGKEIRVFLERLEGQLQLLEPIPFTAKFGGASGNFNAHHVAFPQVDWEGFANRLVQGTLGLKRTRFTTQIEPYDHLAAQLDGIKRINNILLDLSRDFWAYISLDYFLQRTLEGEVGSSAMPHKVNPIDFENAEGNLGIANAMLEHLASKLPVSRLQRDLSDSTVLRNLGVPMGHSLLAVASIQKGLDKLLLNESRIREDLNSHWVVISEALQTILRREQYPQPYEALKALTRGKGPLDRGSLHAFIEGLTLSDQVKEELKRITPENYTGIF